MSISEVPLGVGGFNPSPLPQADQLDLVKVVWRDSWFDYEGEDDQEDYLVTTVGYIVKRTPLYLSLAAELLPDGQRRAVTHITQSTVVSVE